VANFGLPIELNLSTTGDFIVDLLDAKAVADYLRKDADVMLFFAGDADVNGFCGLAYQRNWTDQSGDPVDSRWHPTNGLDLRGKDDSHAAIVTTTGVCTTLLGTALHEFGHLFGAGHEISAQSALNAYLVFRHLRNASVSILRCAI
jgi:hypothetical protein